MQYYFFASTSGSLLVTPLLKIIAWITCRPSSTDPRERYESNIDFETASTIRLRETDEAGSQGLGIQAAANKFGSISSQTLAGSSSQATLSETGSARCDCSYEKLHSQTAFTSGFSKSPNSQLYSLYLVAMTNTRHQKRSAPGDPPGDPDATPPPPPPAQKGRRKAPVVNAKRARKPSQKAAESAITARQRKEKEKKQQKAPRVVPKIIAPPAPSSPPLPQTQSNFVHISNKENAFLQQLEAIRNGQVREETVGFPLLPIGQVYKIVIIWGRASHKKLPKAQVISSKVKGERQVLELEDLIKSWSTKWPKRLYYLDLTAIIRVQLDETVYASTEGTP
ncbi:uncharacterized protein BDZ99DRAFT_478970 [Mytilinidion resinicola]|uniref:Uncharacterized protein n=1 Tax=Mytilinidion resinicola TaxID=574789 RepID=A0A6A6YHM2_9PEZI|nr:uncharacterized protein BDZ99DRAFT_478970 [Mytilinidion resinicola]KAF2807504.1 hypothetical protein BDZ99DRAFT_478970 [Mytilinidion resinicola]